MRLILNAFLLCICFVVTGCGVPTQYGTMPYDDSKPYVDVPANTVNDIVMLMQGKGYSVGEFKALPLARVLKYKERYLGGPRDILSIGWFTSIQAKDKKIYYIYWSENKPLEIKTVSDVLWLYFIDDSNSNLIINRKKEANIINRDYWINWIE